MGRRVGLTGPRVLGVDPSLTGTGLALPDATTTLVRTAKQQPGDADIRRRMRTIRNAVCQHAQDVDLVVLEDLARGAKGSAVHHLAGLAYAIRMGLDTIGAAFVIVGAGQLKKYATGKGNAPKPDMRMALYQRAGIDQPDDNLVDAIWLRLLGLDALGDPVIRMPAVHRSVLDKIEWPAAVGGL